MTLRPLWILVPAAVLAAAAGWLAGHEAGEAPPDLAAIEAPLVAAAREAAVDADLLRALVVSESSGRVDARSAAGALGLTQLLPSTAAEQAQALGLAAPSEAQLLGDAALNLRLGAAYLARLLARFEQSEPFALAAYNAGATNVLRWRAKAVDADPLGVIRREAFPATRAYVERVLALRARYAAR